MNASNSTPAPQLAVVVCTHNRSRSLCETLASLMACAEPAQRVDILVVANACADDTVSELVAFKARHSAGPLHLSWIEEPEPGKSNALNAALAHTQRTQHTALCFIDDDQVVEAGFLNALLTGLQRYPAEDIFCGRIWPAWDGTEPAWVHAKAPYRIPIRPFPEFDLGTQTRPLAPDERLPSGGNITVRRRVLDQVGGFSVDLGPTGHNLEGGEDHDFLQRALAAGFSIRYLPAVRQLHAIDPERMRTGYVLRKSFLRSRSSFLVEPPVPGPRLYMLKKVLGHALGAVFTGRADRRFHALVRTAASLGEWSGAVEVARRARATQQPLSGNPR